MTTISGNAYANPLYTPRYMAPVYPMYMHNADDAMRLMRMERSSLM